MQLRKIPNGNMWRVTRRYFFEGGNDIKIVDRLDRPKGEYRGRPLAHYAVRFDVGWLYGLPLHPDYAVVVQRSPLDSPRRVLLVRIDGDDRTVVGGLDEWGLHIDRAHRGQRLGGWLAWAGMSLSDVMVTEYEQYSRAGYAAFAEAHRIAVDIAVASGRDVPRDVLDEEPLEMPAYVETDGVSQNGFGY